MSETKTQIITVLIAYILLILIMRVATPESMGTISRSVFLAYIAMPTRALLAFLWRNKFTEKGIRIQIKLYFHILPKYFALPFGVFMLCTGVSYESPYLKQVWLACVVVQKVVGGGLEAFGHGLYSLLHGGRWDLWLICMLVEFCILKCMRIPQKRREERMSFDEWKAWRAKPPYGHSVNVSDPLRVMSDDEYLRITEGEPKRLPRKSTSDSIYVEGSLEHLLDL